MLDWTTLAQTRGSDYPKQFNLPRNEAPKHTQTFSSCRHNAYGKGLRAVFAVVRKEEARSTAFYSKKLLLAEQRYSGTESEWLAVTWAIELFSYNLICKPFQLETDHKALTFLQTTTKHLYGKLASWTFNTTLHHLYRLGAQDSNARSVQAVLARK